MARALWLVLAGCLALLPCLLPGCGNTCLNPQPEPPGGGCSEADRGIGTGRADAGPEFRADGGRDSAPDDGETGDSAPDAATDQREDQADAGADGAPRDDAPETSTDSDATSSGDAEDDGAIDPGDAASVDTSSDFAGEARDGTARDSSSDAPGTDDAPDAPIGDGQARRRAPAEAMTR